MNVTILTAATADLATTGITAESILSFIKTNPVICFISALSIIEVAPIKVNPWRWLGKTISRVINGEVISLIEKKNDEVVKMVETKNDELLKVIDRNEAKISRYRIIRFDDEIRHGKGHTEEHYNQIVSDIDDYEDYCKENPDFQNGKAKSSATNIKEKYYEHKKNNTFMQ